MTSSASILMFGQDSQLLEIRSWVLQKCGYRVTSVGTLEQLEEQLLKTKPVLLILCHTLRPSAFEGAMQLVASHAPGLSTLVLMTSASPYLPGHAGEAIRTFDTLDGPAEFLGAVEALLEGKEYRRSIGTMATPSTLPFAAQPGNKLLRQIMASASA